MGLRGSSRLKKQENLRRTMHHVWLKLISVKKLYKLLNSKERKWLRWRNKRKSLGLNTMKLENYPIKKENKMKLKTLNRIQNPHDFILLFKFKLFNSHLLYKIALTQWLLSCECCKYLIMILHLINSINARMSILHIAEKNSIAK